MLHLLVDSTIYNLSVAVGTKFNILWLIIVYRANRLLIALQWKVSQEFQEAHFC